MMMIARLFTLWVALVLWPPKDVIGATDFLKIMDAEKHYLSFSSGFSFLSRTASGQALEQRTEWVNQLQEQITDLLESNDENIIACATGIGYLRDGKVMADFSDVYMDNADISHTQGLSVVLPKAKNIDSTLLCLPQANPRDTYETHPKTEPDAVYKCKNAFVIADRKRWESDNRKSSTVLYFLKYVNKGNIVGSSLANNIFLIYNSTKQLRVVADSERVSNTFVLQDSLFRGIIVIKGKPQFPSTIDFGNVKTTLAFTWNHEFEEGRVQFGRYPWNYFNIYPKDKQSNLQFYGRIGKLDNINCDYHKYYRNITNNKFITVDGRGGHSVNEIDFIADCPNTIVQPWTNVVGSLDSNVEYMAHVQLQNNSSSGIALTYPTLSIAKIIPRQSKFVVNFEGNSFTLSRTESVVYSPTNNSLIWHFWHTDSTTMYLIIDSYLVVHDNINSKVQTRFIDSFTGATIYPVIKLQSSETDIISIREFDAIGAVDTSLLKYDDKFSVNIKEN